MIWKKIFHLRKNILDKKHFMGMIGWCKSQFGKKLYFKCKP